LSKIVGYLTFVTGACTDPDKIPLKYTRIGGHYDWQQNLFLKSFRGIPNYENRIRKQFLRILENSVLYLLFELSFGYGGVAL
jgi:hypothetical protein